MAAAGVGAGALRLAELSAKPLGAAKPLSLGSLRGKVLLVLNELQQRYGPRGLQVLGFPCNQFGHQENGTNDEILPMLEHVRPGNGYKPNFTMFEKCEVNGKDAHPLFTFLKEALPFPHDDPSSLMTNPQYIIWSPVCRNDIAWNFEKFLIGPDGVPFKRYSRRFETIKIQDDIELLLQKVA
ncbi:Glutathione peroxidase 1 [Lonchura striata]|uniref:Glutathione peroxidase 1 n=1 Tax=Lonchura striata TaxID=40157 RepID=A0A218VC74_9PASE|nr:Glutathione peroxidase 1 [Lonchura striata domestica]